MAQKSKITIVSGGNSKVNAIIDDEIVLKTDQTVRNGGDGTAPEPYTVYLASIGTCAGAYVFAFCNKRDISTDEIRIIQTNSTENGKMTIELTIEVPKDFPEKYKKALIKSAELCAVKKSIQNSPEFVTKTVVK